MGKQQNRKYLNFDTASHRMNACMSILDIGPVRRAVGTGFPSRLASARAVAQRKGLLDFENLFGACIAQKDVRKPFFDARVTPAFGIELPEDMSNMEDKWSS